MRCIIILFIISACHGQINPMNAAGGTVQPAAATFANPPKLPATGSTYLFTDATAAGTCSGGGVASAVCRWNGRAWLPRSVGPFPGASNTVVLLGDSITMFNAPSADGYLAYNGQAYFTWANAFLKQGFQVVNYAGVSGNTTTQMLARVSTDVVAYSPGWCVVMGGTNDITTGVSSSTIISNLKSIYTALNNAGIRMVLLTILPDSRYGSDSTGQATWVTVNLWMKEWAKQQSSVVLVDTAAAIIDATNPNLAMISTCCMDSGTHPNMSGSYLLGQAIANALSTAMVPPATLPEWNRDPLNFIVNTMNAGTGGSTASGATGSVATSWTLTNNGTTCAGSKGTRSDGLPGVTQIITMTGSGTTSHCDYTQTISGWSNGDTLWAQAEIMAGSVIDHHFLLVMNYHTAGGDYLYTWGGETSQSSQAAVSQTLPSTIVVRTAPKQIWGAILSITAGIYVYGTSGAITVGRVEVRKVVAPSSGDA